MQLTAICRSLSCKDGLTRSLSRRRVGIGMTIRVMKLTAILLTFACLQVSARMDGQTVTLKVKDAPIKEVFRAIQKQTGMNILVKESLLQKAGKVTLDVKNMPVDQVLTICLKNQPLNFSFEGGAIVIKPAPTVVLQPTVTPIIVNEPPPPLTVKGRILNEQGEPVEGVTVLVKGSKKATSTDANGYFELKDVDENATLTFTGTNIERFEVKVNGRSELSISLKNKVSSLADVTVTVNTGYEKIPRERSTGSFEFVSNEELNRVAGSDLLTRLDGVTTSIFFDKRLTTGTQNATSLNNVTIRGLSTLTTSPPSVSQPLVIVNNIPYDGDITNLNPNDVESITILKDAGATSIYGARAANGVIVITTKQGKFSQPLRVSLSSNIAVMEKPDLFRLPQMSSSDFIEVETFLFRNGFYNSDLANQRYPALSPVVELLAKRRAGSISAADSAAAIDAYRMADVRQDFDKYIYQRSLSQQYFLNLNGGGDKFKYAGSVGLDKNLASLVGNESKRITINISNTFIPTRNLSMTWGVRYTNQLFQNNSLGEYNHSLYGFRAQTKEMLPYTRFADNNGNLINLAQDFRLPYLDTAGNGRLLNWYYNPIQEMRLSENPTKSQDVVLSANISYRIIRGMQASINYQYQNTSGRSENYASIETYYTRNLINRYTNLTSTVPTTRNPIPVSGILDQLFRDQTAHFGRGQLSFDRLFNGKHQINALAGGEIKEVRNSSSGKRLYGYNDTRASSAIVDLVTAFPLYGNRGTGTIPSGSIGITGTLDHFVSLFGNAAYSYDNRYIITASGRKDASNIIGVDINNKWSPFWSVGLGWNINNERFFQSHLFDLLKVRATYGKQGNVNNSLSPYTILNFIAASSNTTFNLPVANIRTPANSGLGWENVKQTNIGVDFSILKNRISGSVEWYRKKAEDLILSADMDLTTGLSSVAKNSATMATKGVDIILESWNIKNVFSWKTQATFSHVSSKILDNKTDNNGIVSGIVGQSGIYVSVRRNFAPFSIYSYPFAGLDPVNGDPLGYLGKVVSKDYQAISNQKLDTANIIYHGSAVPTFFGNFNNMFSWKGISLTVNIQYRLGYYFRKNTISYFQLYQRGRQHSDYSDRWKVPGDEAHTTVPSMVYPLSNSRRDDFYAAASVNVFKGDNIRLQYIRASYDFSEKVVRKAFFQGIQLYALVENIGLIWKANKAGLDPDYNTGNGYYLPPTRITTGIKLQF